MERKKIVLIGLLFLLSSTIVAGEKYALLIGINDYEHSQIQDLNYSEADARLLRDILIRYARYKSQNIRMLLGREATYTSIKDAIYWLGQMADYDDDVFYYFSGHGTRIDDTDGNEEDGMDEAFCPYETDLARPASVILDDEIGHWFKRIRAQKIIVILDCCHSGGAAGRGLEEEGARGLHMSSTRGARGGLLDPDDDPYARDLTLNNKFIITASDANEQSYENPKLGHGVFTYYLGDAIRGSADYNGDKKISALEMFEYTKTKTLEFAKSIRRKQTPIKFGSIDDAIVVEISKQLCSLNLYDRDLNLVGLGIGKDLVDPGDLFIVKKTMQTIARDLEIADRDIFQIEITNTYDSYSEGKIVKSYYKNIRIDPSNYGEYYAEKLSFGSIHILTEPWSTIYIDGNEMGPSPMIISDVPEGEHEIEFRIQMVGYPQHVRKTVTVVGDSTLRIVEAFEKQDN